MLNTLKNSARNCIWRLSAIGIFFMSEKSKLLYGVLATMPRPDAPPRRAVLVDWMGESRRIECLLEGSVADFWVSNKICPAIVNKARGVPDVCRVDTSIGERQRNP